jgi:signal transduction histidine kinase
LAVAGVLIDRLLHDLKQPLNLIRISAQELRLDARKNRVDLSALPGQLQQIEAAVDALVKELDQLRTFARAKSATPPDAVTVDLTQIAHAVAARAERTHPGRAVEVDVPPGLHCQAPSALAISQIMWELCDNALHATATLDAAEARVNVRMVDAGETVRLEVHDNGVGIDAALCDRVFAPFFTTRAGAAGVGLALVKALAKDAGTDVVVQTAPGDTCFSIQFAKAEDA